MDGGAYLPSWTWLSIDKFCISSKAWIDGQVCQGTRKPVAAAQEMGFHKPKPCEVFFFGKNAITPWKIKMEPTNHPWKERKMIFQTSMIMFHLNLPGCKDSLNSLKDKPFFNFHFMLKGKCHINVFFWLNLFPSSEYYAILLSMVASKT